MGITSYDDEPGEPELDEGAEEDIDGDNTDEDVQDPLMGDKQKLNVQCFVFKYSISLLGFSIFKFMMFPSCLIRSENKLLLCTFVQLCVCNQNCIPPQTEADKDLEPLVVLNRLAKANVGFKAQIDKLQQERDEFQCDTSFKTPQTDCCKSWDGVACGPHGRVVNVSRSDFFTTEEYDLVDTTMLIRSKLDNVLSLNNSQINGNENT
ncbi:hypothetical protein Tco_1016322 [Tanacetum coccineum]|uniref:Leucine-rich repeat-containing N-terminal plant-type domain-containing protein n=1 Tax=Tanacetum coccineum TaxID=301880 RepID=A0ABQ5FQ88_9ASTR